jgi:hypothetical protein
VTQQPVVVLSTGNTAPIVACLLECVLSRCLTMVIFVTIFSVLLGNVMGKLTIFFLASCIFANNAALYGCLGGILIKGHSVLESVGLGVAFVFGTASIYVICSTAHQVTDTVRS